MLWTATRFQLCNILLNMKLHKNCKFCKNLQKWLIKWAKGSEFDYFFVGHFASAGRL